MHALLCERREAAPVCASQRNGSLLAVKQLKDEQLPAAEGAGAAEGAHSIASARRSHDRLSALAEEITVREARRRRPRGR